MRYTYRYSKLRRNPHHLPVSITLLAIFVTLVVVFRISNLSLAAFLLDFSQSLFKVVLSYVISLALALTLSLITLKNKHFESIFLPILDVLQSFPSFALVPLLIAYWGVGLFPVVFVLVTEMLWPMLFALIGTYKNIRQDLADAATICGATGLRRLWYFTLPALLPGLTTGSIVAWGEAWETVIGAEIILFSPGLGLFFSKIDTSHAGLTLVAVTGLMFILYIVNKLIWLPMLEHVTAYQTD